VSSGLWFLDGHEGAGRQIGCFSPLLSDMLGMRGGWWGKARALHLPDTVSHSEHRPSYFTNRFPIVVRQKPYPQCCNHLRCVTITSILHLTTCADLTMCDFIAMNHLKLLAPHSA